MDESHIAELRAELVGIVRQQYQLLGRIQEIEEQLDEPDALQSPPNLRIILPRQGR